MSRPEERVADLLVGRFQLTPPVDVSALIEYFGCDLEYCGWPTTDCDAVVTDLGTGRARIFVRKGMVRTRRRFTLAHELGHVVIGWHLNTVMCDAAPNAADDPVVLGVDQEGEANRFASRLLVPVNFREKITEGNPYVPRVLDALAAAEVSAPAGLLAIASHLAPGVVLRTPSLAWPVFSDGTGAGIKQMAQEGRWQRLKERAVDSGAVDHQGQRVRWYSFWDPHEPDPDQDPRDTKTLLRDALRLVEPDEAIRDKLRMSISGVIGFALADKSIAEPALLLASLSQRFESDTRFASLSGVDEFHWYLQRKVLEVAARRSAAD